ncbi:PilZ domain-containing protein [Thiococcus pfennigii]|uniref:PilZ domain-containing protein n=1 Tax=Thiococcus pfennigii TaxID=1057 RepID=UPI0019077900|nr:PilZ domain-containing protein [Thiococcus pfennigii]MBK1700972.1 hypothetical protein [Thiococcus pfennigii]
MGSDPRRTAQTRNRRYHRRLPMTTAMTIAFGDGETPVTIQNLDISWGGIRFAVAREAMPPCERLWVNFPWTKGRIFSVEAEVLRREPLEDGRDAVAARFCRLSTRDQQRLDKLLELLHGDELDERSHSLVPVLEVMMSDDDEVHLKLAELAAGQLTVTVFETYEVNQSIRLVLGGVGDHPPLRLRARVLEIGIAPTGEDSAWLMYNLKLRFEHPPEELKALAHSLEKGLAKPTYG